MVCQKTGRVHFPQELAPGAVVGLTRATPATETRVRAGTRGQWTSPISTDLFSDAFAALSDPPADQRNLPQCGRQAPARHQRGCEDQHCFCTARQIRVQQ